MINALPCCRVLDRLQNSEVFARHDFGVSGCCVLSTDYCESILYFAIKSETAYRSTCKEVIVKLYMYIHKSLVHVQPHLDMQAWNPHLEKDVMLEKVKA